MKPGTAQRFLSGGAGERAKRAKMGVRGLAPGKFFETTPFRSSENALFKKILLSLRPYLYTVRFRENSITTKRDTDDNY